MTSSNPLIPAAIPAHRIDLEAKQCIPVLEALAAKYRASDCEVSLLCGRMVRGRISLIEAVQELCVIDRDKAIVLILETIEIDHGKDQAQ